MTFQTWQKEFYPVPAHEVPASEALAHSLKKWQGLRHIKEHGVRFLGGTLYGYKNQESLEIDSSSCALCVNFDECIDCPLALVRGRYPCCEAMEDEYRSPFSDWLFDANPEPMISWLEKAAQFVQETQP